MSKNIIFVLMYHCHKLLDLTGNRCVTINVLVMFRYLSWLVEFCLLSRMVIRTTHSISSEYSVHFPP
jgi:hypothetical protein